MKILFRPHRLILIAALLLGIYIALPAEPAADNSANNAGDRCAEAVTPQKQSNSDADVKVTRAIRRAIYGDSSLSVDAHNIKIITTKEHVVYLRGAISASDNREKIASLAKANADGYTVKNQISVNK